MDETRFLKTVNQLRGMNFIVKSYQRGYRWEEEQVIDLLNDLQEFRKNQEERPKESNIYCLQPLVIKRIQENEYEIIDGQQRLTTIYILLKFLGKKVYNISYETREGSKEFLEKIDQEAEISTKNIDYYFMKNAYNVIKNWFRETEIKNEDGALGAEFEILLLGGKPQVQFIWYEIEEQKYAPEEVFSRMNVGKIPLNDAELIKAKLLFFVNQNNEKNNYERQLEIGNEWDTIEQSLRNESFWRFIVNEKIQKNNRIEYIFDYIAQFNKDKKKKSEYYTYEEIQKRLEKDSNNYELWNKKVKKYYNMFEEWYNDIELYNYIGFLNLYGKETYKLIDEYENKCKEKDEFKKRVKQLVIKSAKEEIAERVEDICELTYEEDYTKLKKLLILLNIIADTKIKQRFPFERCLISEWSIEHIHPQNPEKLTDDKKKWIKWSESEIKTATRLVEKFKSENLEKASKYEEIIGELTNIKDNATNLKTNQLQHIFENISNKIMEDYGKKDINTLGNLALLDKNLNSEINNNFFDTKRENIIEAEKRGIYVPTCTKNVFMKFYSNNPDQLYFWNDDDRREYRKAMEKMLKEFYGEGEKINDK